MYVCSLQKFTANLVDTSKAANPLLTMHKAAVVPTYHMSRTIGSPKSVLPFVASSSSIPRSLADSHSGVPGIVAADIKSYQAYYLDCRSLIAIEEFFLYNNAAPPLFNYLPGNPQLVGLNLIQHLATPISLLIDPKIYNRDGFSQFAVDVPVENMENRTQITDIPRSLNTTDSCRAHYRAMYDALRDEVPGRHYKQTQVIEPTRDVLAGADDPPPVGTSRIRGLL